MTAGKALLTYNQMIVGIAEEEERADRLFGALANSTRRDIVRRTMKDDYSVSQLARCYTTSFAAIQKHVSILEAAGLVSKRSSGREQIVTGDTLCDRGMPLELAPAEYPDPLYSVAVTPKTKADAAKISPTLTRLAEQDPTLRWRQDISTRETILSGMGDTHINVAIRRMEETFSLGLDTAVPRVPYMETITKSSSAQYRHKKQTGGAGQFAEVHMRVEPRERDSGFEFAWEVVGMNVSKTFGPCLLYTSPSPRDS